MNPNGRRTCVTDRGPSTSHSTRTYTCILNIHSLTRRTLKLVKWIY